MKINNDDQIIFEQYIKDEFNHLINNDFKIELVLKPNCNQSCDYCYLNKIYPEEKRISNNQILNNIKILFKYLNDNNYIIYHWDLFAGDLFYDNFWFEIMDLFYDYYNNLNYKNSINILIPCNFSFCKDKNKIIQVQNYINKFKNINININLSYSTDGKYQNNVREKKELTDEFYNNVFTLLEKNNWECHPMISYEGIHNSIKNYDWWIKQYNTYNLSGKYPPMLEVRNHGWTDDTIEEYLKLLDHIIQHRFSLLDYDIEKFTYYLFDNNNNNNIKRRDGLDPIILTYFPKYMGQMFCSLGNNFTINCSDLSIIPCHRLPYSFFTGGNFYLDTDNIVKIKVNEGINGYFAHKMVNNFYNLDCYECVNKNFCIKGCRGAQFEYNAESFLPIKSVCNLFNKKINFLLNKYDQMGVFNKLFELNILDKEQKYYLLKLLKEKGYNKYEYQFL